MSKSSSSGEVRDLFTGIDAHLNHRILPYQLSITHPNLIEQFLHISQPRIHACNEGALQSPVTHVLDFQNQKQHRLSIGGSPTPIREP